MTTPTLPPRPVGETVLELLTAVLAPDLRARVLTEALALEGSDAIPEDLARARAFVEGPLRLVVKRRVGPGVAQLVVDTIAPIFATDVPRHEELTVIGKEQYEEDTDIYRPGHVEQQRALVSDTVVPPAAPRSERRRLTGRSGVARRGGSEGARDGESRAPRARRASGDGDPA